MKNAMRQTHTYNLELSERETDLLVSALHDNVLLIKNNLSILKSHRMTNSPDEERMTEDLLNECSELYTKVNNQLHDNL